MPDDRFPVTPVPGDDEALHRFLDALARNEEGSDAPFDEATSAALRRFYRQATTPLPSEARERAWEEVRSRIASKQVGRQHATRRLLRPFTWDGDSSQGYVARPAAAPRPIADSPARGPVRRAATYIAPAVLVLVVLITSLMTLQALIIDDAPGGTVTVSTFRGGNARTGVMPGSGPGESAIVKWDRYVGQEMLGSVAVVDGVIYATGGRYVPKDWATTDTGSGVIVALDTETGAVQWRRDVVGFVGTSPAVDDGSVYVATEAGELLALDTETGDQRWRFDIGDRPFNSSPAVSDGTVYINAGGVTSSPAVLDGVVYVGSGRTERYRESVTIAVDAATGSERWRFASSTNGFYALEASSGSVRWSFPTQTLIANSAAVANDTVFVVDAGSHALIALDVDSGSPRWRFSLDAGGAYATPAITSDLVYVTDQLGNLYAVDAATGTERWRYLADALVNASPAVAADALYLADRVGNIVVIDAATGHERGTIENAGEIGHGAVPSPVIVDGVLFVARVDGRLVAFGPAPPTPP